MTELSLSVQYGAASTELPRWRLRRWLHRALDMACGTTPADIAGLVCSLRLVGTAEGRALNREYRGRDYATNVLTFEYGQGPDAIVRSDIVICLPVLKREAREQKKTLVQHACHLTVHGALHALGYDHGNAREARKMESLETAILASLGLPDPYLVR